jgi:hypothetical protein
MPKQQPKALSKRVSRLEAQVKEMTRKVPARPEDLVRPGYRGSVEADLARLQGRSRSDLMMDQDRGPSSPLGQPRAEGKRK